jgi:hypothetical protein
MPLLKRRIYYKAQLAKGVIAIRADKQKVLLLGEKSQFRSVVLYKQRSEMEAPLQ